MDRGRDSEMELDGDKAVSHSCCVCGKSFPFQSSLSQHMRKHTGEKPYKCPYCDHRASQKGNLKIHIRSHRTGTLVQSHEVEASEAPLDELRTSGGLDMCASPAKTLSACNQILNGALPGDSGKILLRSGRKETDTVGGGEGTPFCKGAPERKRGPDLPAPQAPRPFKCRLCSYVTLREDSLLSHVEKDHITAQAPSGGGADTAAENGRSEPPAGEFPCEVCGQAFSQTWFLKAHMKKHRGSFDHGCHICGRRFKEPWFLKNHLKAHGPKAAGKNRPRSEMDPIATINNVVQEETIVSGLSLYEVCPKCGNLFTNLASLSAHNAVHQRTEDGAEPGPVDAQQRFLHSLSLRPAGRPEARTVGRRVAELDPVSSYQLWALFLVLRWLLLLPDVPPPPMSSPLLKHKSNVWVKCAYRVLPRPGKPAEKQRAPSPTPAPKQSGLDSAKAKLGSPPPCQPPGKGDGAQPLPPRETLSKATPEPRMLGGVSGARSSPALQASPSTKQEPAEEGPPGKHLDIVSIFKTFIPKDLATLYQSWGSSGPALEHRGTLRLQACQGDLQCAQCGKHFTQPSHLRAHARAHAGESPS
ncbi:zinc finger protein 516 [Echinops telfairi]|uniref:Zinc finger protein 516 n=1 Tax=Echinops telfairi TaxID=9371 RepID=A0AC55DK05_ECHTE|nr:zinc finger protein 516 [Echinops telfairi]